LNCWDLDCWDLNCRDVICEKRIKKHKNSKTICRVFIQNKSKIEKGEKLI